MSTISTHVLNTSSGKAAANVGVRLLESNREIGRGSTDTNGRCASLLPPGAELAAGVYRLVFDVEPIFPEGFYPEISVVFLVRDPAAHYHIPLLISPFGYTTYRGT
jgi:5-hydroxyisourate hydrolase